MILIGSLLFVCFNFCFSKLDCGNGLLPGTNTGDPNIDDPVAAAVGGASAQWCTKYNVPFEQDGNYTQQHFARLWFDLLVDSPQFLGVDQGESDPYVWTMGQGCGYSLGGVRFPYTKQSDQSILGNASGELYYIDEGVSLGAVDRNLLMGGTVPKVGDYSYENPLQKVEVIQTGTFQSKKGRKKG